MLKRLILSTWIAAALLCAASQEVHASERLHDTLRDNYEPPQPERLVDPMVRKLGRGSINLITGPVELPRQLVHTVRSDGALVGLPVGFVKGLMMAAIRSGVGFSDMLFFMSSAPNNYGTVIVPEYVWQSPLRTTF